MADIPLVSTKNIMDIVSSNADIVIVPGRMGGTNAVFIRDPASFHVVITAQVSLNTLRSLQAFIQRSLTLLISVLDIDEVPDLIEVLLHGKGQSKEYLKKIGIDISANGGRVGVKR